MVVSERRHFVKFCTKMVLNSGAWQILILPPGRERVKENEAALNQRAKHGKYESRLYMYSSRLAYGFHKGANIELITIPVMLKWHGISH